MGIESSCHKALQQTCSGVNYSEGRENNLTRVGKLGVEYYRSVRFGLTPVRAFAGDAD